MTSKLRVAVVHDWLTGMRGGEAVLEGILKLFPDADLFTLLHNKGSVSAFIENRNIYTSFIDRLPLKKNRYRNYLPLFPAAIETFEFKAYDLVVSSSHCVAKGVIVPPGIPHLCFVHSPMRYVWDMTGDYFPYTNADGTSGGFFSRWIFPFFANYLRIWDSASAPRVDRYVCNSKFVAERLRRFYGMNAGVVNPPCLEIAPPIKSGPREEFFLVVSALVPYKRIDLAVETFNHLGSNFKLKIVGKGPELKRLKSMAADNIEFLGSVSREEITQLYATARGLVFPGIEDFGIVPVEAQTHGCPVIAFARGGALETVTTKTGVFFHEQSVQSLAQAVQSCSRIKFKAVDFQKNVSRFSQGNFLTKMSQEIDRLRRNKK
ncbi:MAG: glycosyltransferase [Leptospirales bacterium]|nr:glycosyltransferase [Leptospirales bacterium]